MIVASVIIILAWITNLVILRNWEETDRGTFGDMFGVVNSLFAGLGLAGIIFTILLQNQALLEARKQFLIQKQENTIFQLLGLHNNIISQINYSIPNGKITYEGKAFFNHVSEMLKGTVINNKNTSLQGLLNLLLENPTEEDMEDNLLRSALYTINQHYGNLLEPYCNNIYFLLKYINNCQLSDNEKQDYINLVAAQMSSSELHLFLFNTIYSSQVNEREMLISIIGKYDLLNNFDFDKIGTQDHQELILKRYFNNIILKKES